MIAGSETASLPLRQSSARPPASQDNDLQAKLGQPGQSIYTVADLLTVGTSTFRVDPMDSRRLSTTDGGRAAYSAILAY